MMYPISSFFPQAFSQVPILLCSALLAFKSNMLLVKQGTRAYLLHPRGTIGNLRIISADLYCASAAAHQTQCLFSLQSTIKAHRAQHFRDLLQLCPTSCLVRTLHKYQDCLPLYFLLQDLWFFCGYICQLLYYKIKSRIRVLYYSLHFFIPLIKTESVFQYHDDTLIQCESGYDWPTDTKRKRSKLPCAPVGHCPEMCRYHLTLLPLIHDVHKAGEQQRWLCPSVHSWATQLRLAKVWREEESQQYQFSLARYSCNSSFCWNQLWAVTHQKHVCCLRTGLQNQERQVWIKQMQRTVSYIMNLCSATMPNTVLFHPSSQNLTFTRTNSRS